jgi:ribokinase
LSSVIIFGSINMDCVARLERHPLPGETLLGKDLNYFPGGKGANQAVAAQRAGANTNMIGRVGSDGFADFMLHFLKNEKIDISCITRQNGATGTAFIAVDDQGENSIIVIPGANGDIKDEDFTTYTINKGDILICQNEIPPGSITAAFQHMKQTGGTIIYNPAPALPISKETMSLADIVIVNESEYEFYTGQLDPTSQIIVQTLGANGVKVTGPDTDFTLPGHNVNVVDTTGAGDCFTGALAAALSKGNSIGQAATFANKAASLAVQKHGAGTGMPYLHEIE